MAVNSYHKLNKFTGITHGCKPKDFFKAFKVFILSVIVTKQQQPAMWCKSQCLSWAKTYRRIRRSPCCCFWISQIYFYTFPLMLVFSAIRLFKHSRTLSTEEQICAWSEDWSIRQRRGIACHMFLIYWSSCLKLEFYQDCILHQRDDILFHYQKVT